MNQNYLIRSKIWDTIKILKGLYLINIVKLTIDQFTVVKQRLERSNIINIYNYKLGHYCLCISDQKYRISIALLCPMGSNAY